MTNVADAAPASGQAQPPARTSLRGMLAQTEIDLRLFGMLVALAAILVTFNILSGGKLLQPTNMVTMAVQAAGIAIIATGMVLIIVSRNIDLSIGSILVFIGHGHALLHDRVAPVAASGRPSSRPISWIVVRPSRGRRGRRDRRRPGIHRRLHRRAVVHRDARRSLSIRRGAAFRLADAAVTAPLDSTFQLSAAVPRDRSAGP